MDYDEVIQILKKARPYIKKVHNDAESIHDNYGELYMDYGLYEIMQDTEKLLAEIDEALKSEIG